MRSVPLKNTSRLAQLVERVTSNDEVSRSSRLMGIFFASCVDQPSALEAAL